MRVFVDFGGLRARGIFYSKQHLLRLEKAGKFPKRVRLNGRNGRVQWDQTEIDRWQDQLLAERTEPLQSLHPEQAAP